MTTKPVIKTWKDLNIGGVIESGTSEHFHTGDWRSKVPIWQSKNCIQCMNCWAICPDHAVQVKEGKRGEYDYNFCKGCGLCAEECPITTKAIMAVSKIDAERAKKLNAWDGANDAEFADKVSIKMVSLKEAKEKHGVK